MPKPVRAEYERKVGKHIHIRNERFGNTILSISVFNGLLISIGFIVTELISEQWCPKVRD